MEYKENLIVKEEIGVILPDHFMKDSTDIYDQVSIKKAVNEKKLFLEIGMTFEWNNKMYIVTDYKPVFTWNIVQWTYFIKHP